MFRHSYDLLPSEQPLQLLSESTFYLKSISFVRYGLGNVTHQFILVAKYHFTVIPTVGYLKLHHLYDKIKSKDCANLARFKTISQQKSL